MGFERARRLVVGLHEIDLRSNERLASLGIPPRDDRLDVETRRVEFVRGQIDAVAPVLAKIAQDVGLLHASPRRLTISATAG